MVASRFTHWVRCVLIAGLCYGLVGQTLLVQAAGIATATTDFQTVICHGNGDQSPADTDENPLARCHFCWLPGSSAVLLPEANFGIAAPIAFAAPAYFFFSASITVVKPPPRGFSRAPPSFA
jgi:hypothetical protein